MAEHKCGFVYCFRDDTVFVHELQMWRCPDHRKDDSKAVRSVSTSSDVERAATLAWNEALEAALAIVRDNLEWQGPCPTGDAIRALKRTT